MHTLTHKDKKILYELDFDCRQSNAKIGKKINVSKDVVNYRIKRLEKANIIKKYNCSINLEKLSYTTYRFLLRLINMNFERKKQLINFLETTKNVWILGENEGEWDFAFTYITKVNSEFYEFYESFIGLFREIIDRIMISQITNYEELPRTYLIKENKSTNTTTIRKKTKKQEEITTLDKEDIKIINLLTENGRKKIIDIAEKLKRSSAFIIKRKKELEKKGIIKGYKAILSIKDIGRDYYGLKIYLNKYSEKKKILEFIRTIPQASAIIHTTGGYDIEFDIEVKTTKEFHEIVDSMKSQFSTIKEIRYIRSSGHYSFKKLNLKYR